VGDAALPAPERARGVAFAAMRMLGYHWGGGAHVLFGILVLLVLVALLTAAAVFVVRTFGGRQLATAAPAHAPGAPLSAREILDRRLASGEIAPEQYDQIRAKLEGGERPAG